MRCLIFASSMLVLAIAGASRFFVDENQPEMQAKLVSVKTLAAVAPSETGPVGKSSIATKPWNLSDELLMLTEKGWRIVSVSSNIPCDTDYDGVLTTDVGSEMPSCALDDVMYLQRDGVAVFERNERCELTEADVEKYNWYYTEINRRLYLARGSIEAMMVLRSVSEDRLMIDIPMQEEGVTHVFTVTYQAVPPTYP